MKGPQPVRGPQQQRVLMCLISETLLLPAKKLVHPFVSSSLDHCTSLSMRVQKFNLITPILKTLHWLPSQSVSPSSPTNMFMEPPPPTLKTSSLKNSPGPNSASWGIRIYQNASLTLTSEHHRSLLSGNMMETKTSRIIESWKCHLSALKVTAGGIHRGALLLF